MKNLLIVESPAKAKTIGKYLGEDYDVVASFGHVRDLPSKTGSVDPSKDFAMNYQINSRASKYINEIVAKAKTCDRLILALDPDREGEAIAWHVLEVLKQKKALKASVRVDRIVFNSITKDSIKEAIKNPRKIDENLVNAQQARRALDYLVGFTLSPVLWRKLPGSRSAGRVQSVALRIICDREDEIEAFKIEEYWDIRVDLSNDSAQRISALLTHINGKKLEKFSIGNEAKAKEISKALNNKSYSVSEVVRKEVRRKPYPPFITSSLQQEASRKLGFTIKKTMQIAQKLYEGVSVDGAVQGLITYMRTDGAYVSAEAITAARDFIKSEYGDNYLPTKPIIYKSKVKNAQEAHEAIRPADFSLSPAKINQYLEKDYSSLYDLIWKRMIASQMQDVVMDQVSATILTDPVYGELRAVGSVIKFKGFYAVYKETEDDKEEEQEKSLPNLKSGDKLELINVSPNQHFTEPAPRYNEASLVKKMEELGIGRPSTYATIISVLQERDYVKLEKKRFTPEERGRLVTLFLKEFFSHYVEYDYTARLEDELDIISNGELDWKDFLKKFWIDFDKNIAEVSKKSISEILDVINAKMGPKVFGVDENGNINNKCETCSNGILGIKLGKFGVFIGCSNYPECRCTKQMGQDQNVADQENKSNEPKLLGTNDDEEKSEIFLKKGPYGFYIELAKTAVIAEVKEKINTKKSKGGKVSKEKKSSKASASPKPKKVSVPKPKRVSVPKNVKIEDVDLEFAKKLLSLPREIGIHPETKLKIVASIGPFGPYLLHNGSYASVKEDDIFEIDLNKAMSIIAINEARKLKKGAGSRKGWGRKK